MLKVVVACGCGMGSSQLLKMNCSNVLKKLGVEHTIHHTSIDEAKSLAKKENKLRAEYYNFYTDKEWGHSTSYDICLDSSRLDEAEIIKLIIAYVEARLKQ